jgi:amidohydrolase
MPDEGGRYFTRTRTPLHEPRDALPGLSHPSVTLIRLWRSAVRRIFYAVSLALSVASVQAQDLRAAIAADYEKNLKSLFLHLHANPELSHREFETAKRLAKELKALGYEVTEGVGKTGVVAVLKNGSGPTVLLRADMDGLPVEEKTGLAYASKARQTDIDGKEQPVMHACGHDVHVTSLVGAARQLMARRKEWSGTLVLIGQPAEERVSGARDMIADSLYTRFPKPEYAVAFHVSARHPAGKVQVPLGIAYSSADSVDVIVHGVGSHGASPHQGIDPVLIAAQIVVSLQSVVSRSINPLQPGVITVGAIHGGTKHNIIGDRVEMQLTVGSDDFATREQLLAGIKRVAEGVARTHGVPDDKLPEVILSRTETTPPTINHEPTARRIREAFETKLGAERMVQQPREGMGAEDFAFFVAPEHNVKGVYFAVGGTPPDQLKTAASHHSPLFRIEPEPSVKSGTEAMVIAAMTLMPR